LGETKSVVRIEDVTRANEDFRREVSTAAHSQLVVMTIQPGEEIGEEVHEGIDQLLVVKAEADEAEHAH
jgi:mannose-6-phosphate isomerase-like protein (cupin superfamily)